MARDVDYQKVIIHDQSLQGSSECMYTILGVHYGKYYASTQYNTRYANFHVHDMIMTALFLKQCSTVRILYYI